MMNLTRDLFHPLPRAPLTAFSLMLPSSSLLRICTLLPVRGSRGENLDSLGLKLPLTTTSFGMNTLRGHLAGMQPATTRRRARRTPPLP